MPWNIAARDKVGKGVTGSGREFAGLAERKNALRVESDGKFAPKPRLDLGDREPQTARHRFGNVEMKSHGLAYLLFRFLGYSTRK